MKLDFEKKLLISIGVFLIFTALIVGAVIYPTVKYVNNLNRQTYEVRLEMEKRHEMIRQMRSSVRQVEKIREESAGFPLFLFRAGDELKLITALENLAAENGVAQKIENSNLDKISGNQIMMALTVNGEYDAVLRYLAALERMDYFINIEQLQFLPENSREKERRVSLHLSLNLYVN